MATEEREELQARERELTAELEDVEAHRQEVAEELSEAREALRVAREAREAGEGSTADLSDAQARTTALSELEEELSGKVSRARSELREVRTQLRREEKLDALAEEARKGAELFEEWDATRRELAQALEELAPRVVGLEGKLERLASRVASRLEQLDASPGALRSRGVELAPLAGYKEPDRNLVRHWGREDPLDHRGAKPERSDLGEADDLVADAVEAAREVNRRAPVRPSPDHASAGAI